MRFELPERLKFDDSLTRHFKSEALKYMIPNDGVLLRRVGIPKAFEWAVCIPEPDVPSLLYDSHDLAGHGGVKPTQMRIHKRAWWPSLTSDLNATQSSKREVEYTKIHHRVLSVLAPCCSFFSSCSLL